MGQKSRHKKQMKQKAAPVASRGNVASVNRGVRLSDLDNTVTAMKENGRPVSAQAASYEMVGDLRHDIRRILIVVLINVVIVAGLVIASSRTDKLNKVGERTAKFLQLQ